MNTEELNQKLERLEQRINLLEDPSRNLNKYPFSLQVAKNIKNLFIPMIYGQATMTSSSNYTITDTRIKASTTTAGGWSNDGNFNFDQHTIVATITDGQVVFSINSIGGMKFSYLIIF